MEYKIFLYCAKIYVLLMRIARFAQDSNAFSAKPLVTRIGTIFNIVVSTIHHLIGPSSLYHAGNSTTCFLNKCLKKETITV